jgi:amino acid transporter
MRGRKFRGLTLAPLIASTYFMVSGGPYGLEELVAKAGYQKALWVLFITPLIWSFPTAFMVGELAGALPQAGGYYVWVRRALGPFWGFQEAWLSLVASIFDMAIYPTLFVLYLGCLFPSLGTGAPAIAIGTGMIAVCAMWNMAGTRGVGRSSLLLGVALLSPFLIMAVLSGSQPAPAVPGVDSPGTGLFAGITIAMWNFMGWDNASTVAGDVEKPERTYPRAMIITVILVTATYVLPVWAAQHAGLDPKKWSTGAWVAAANAISGGWLGTAVVVGGMISAIGSFNSLLMSYAYVPVGLANDGFLPRVFASRAAKTGSPWVAILVCAAAYACCLGLGFNRLVLLDVLLYGLSLSLEFVALVVLRIREPELPRLFRVPGGLVGVVAVGALPMGLLIAAMFYSSDVSGQSGVALSVGPVLALLGPLLYWARFRQAWARFRHAGR